MKTLTTWLAALVAGLAGLAMVALGTLAVTGVPESPTLTTEDVPRLPWGYVAADLDLVRAGMRSKAFAGWLPGDRGMLLRASWRVLDSRLHTLAAPGGEPRLLPELPRNAAAYPADPDRDYVLLQWDEDGLEQFQIHRLDLDGSAPVRLTDGRERAWPGAWEPGGPRVAWSSTRRNGTDSDIWIADPRVPGSEVRVTGREGTWFVYDWSPAGDVLAVGRFVSAAESEVWLLDLAGNDLTRLPGTDGRKTFHAAVRFTPDGRGLWIVSDRDSEFRHLRHLEIATGRERVLSADIPWDVTSVQLSGDGSFLVLSVNEDGRNRYYRFDPATEVAEPLEPFPTGVVSATLHPRLPLLAVNRVDASGVARAWVHDLRTGRNTLWAGEAEGDARPGPVRLVHYPTFDSIDGAPRLIPAFVYPGAGDGPRPVIVNIHGGPEAQAREMPNGVPRYQRRGITVITPNVRGSTGYGKTYAALDDRYLREDAVRDIGALLDWIAGQPDMDADRVAVMGGSYGGYMVLASLVHFGDRLRCGMESVGISNFVTFLENTADYRRDLRRAEYGDERDPEMRRFLEEISPLTHAERIVSPLMVVQGRNDPRVPVSESRQLVERSRDSGGKVRYLEASDEGHGFRKPWNALYSRVAHQQMADACLGVEAPRF